MRIRIQLLIIMLFVVSCQSSKKDEVPSADKANWSGAMQILALDVKKLVPYLYDREAYLDKRNHDEILKYLREFSTAAHHIPTEAGKPILGDDLLVQYSISNLKEDLTRATISFQNGQKEFSRTTAKASLNHCFRCHSVTEKGAASAWDIDISAYKLQPVEKADLLVATRKYDQALSFMENWLNSNDNQKNFAYDFESILRRYLALIIRVENAPTRALKELNRVLSNADTPHYISEQAEGWRESLKKWAKEGRPKGEPKTAKALFDEVERRFKNAARIQRYEKDHSGDVEYLRATSTLHQGLKILKSPADQARALFLLGKAYEVLDELGSWNLHENYYEACVLKDPKTAMARSCYNRLEASLFMGYSGSAGTHLPAEERERLQKLKLQLQ